MPVSQSLLAGASYGEYSVAMTPQQALRRALKIVGGISALARALNIERQAVQQWTVVPVRRVIDVEVATGSQISRHDLRPDIYPESD